MTKSKTIIEGPEIRIIEPIGRFEIVKKAVTHFIEFEKDKKRERYRVQISCGGIINWKETLYTSPRS